MFDTTYHRPKTIAEAVSLFSGDARYISGGQTLLPAMKLRLAAPTALIDISRLTELKGISVAGEVLTVGGGMTHAEVTSSLVVAKAIPALASLAGTIGDPAVRHMGTLGGSLANNDPAADYPAPALALGATIHTNKRKIAAADFFTGLFSTSLEEGEIVTKVDFPIPAKAAYEKFRNPASRYAMAGVFVAVMKDRSVRAGVTGAGNNGVFRSDSIEQALTKSWSPSALESIKLDESAMLSDIHGTAAYRANLVKVMAKRAVAKAG
jgi:carbon-monoxide dehydrogenase medium subunit